MKISRIKNIFVGMITTLAVAAGALNGCGQAANPAESTPNASSEALQEAASDTTSREQTIGKPTADESTDIGGEKITIRIASWYQESYLTNLKSYLSEEFPEYSFHFLYLEKNNYEALMDDQLACKAAPDIVCIDPPMPDISLLYMAKPLDESFNRWCWIKRTWPPHYRIWTKRRS